MKKIEIANEILSESRRSRENYKVRPTEFNLIKAHMYSIFESYAHGIINWKQVEKMWHKSIKEYTDLYRDDKELYAEQKAIMLDEYIRVLDHYKPALNEYKTVNETRMTSNLVVKQQLDESTAKTQSNFYYNKRYLRESELKDITTLKTWNRVVENYPNLTSKDEERVRFLTIFEGPTVDTTQLITSVITEYGKKKKKKKVDEGSIAKASTEQLKRIVRQAEDEQVSAAFASQVRMARAELKKRGVSLRDLTKEAAPTTSPRPRMRPASNIGSTEIAPNGQMTGSTRGFDDPGFEFNPNFGHRDQPGHPENRGLSSFGGSNLAPSSSPRPRTRITPEANMGSTIATPSTMAKMSAATGGFSNIGPRATSTRVTPSAQAALNNRFPTTAAANQVNTRRQAKINNMTMPTVEGAAEDYIIAHAKERMADLEPEAKKAFLAYLEKSYPGITTQIGEGYKILPNIDRDRYSERPGLEGPFRTLSGKVVYYDPKEGSYYDPDTDMYLSYDEFKELDNDYSGMKNDRQMKEAKELAMWAVEAFGYSENGEKPDYWYKSGMTEAEARKRHAALSNSGKWAKVRIWDRSWGASPGAWEEATQNLPHTAYVRGLIRGETNKQYLNVLRRVQNAATGMPLENNVTEGDIVDFSSYAGMYSDGAHASFFDRDGNMHIISATGDRPRKYYIDGEEVSWEDAKRIVGNQKLQPQQGMNEADTSYEKDMDDSKPVIVSGVKGMKSTPFRKKFKNMAAYERWADSEDATNYEVHQVTNEGLGHIGAIQGMMRKEKSASGRNSVTLDYSRYMRSHGKKPRDSGGAGLWMFTTTDYGDPSEDDTFEFSGRFADAKRAAAKWAKSQGADRFYVMESMVNEGINEEGLVGTALKKHKLKKAIRQTNLDRDHLVRQSKTNYFPDYEDAYNALLDKRDKLQAQLKSLETNEDASPEEEDEFHRKLDKLVHKTFGKRPEETNEARRGGGLSSIDWPDEDMAQHAENAIRHGMHAYDAYGHVYSMTYERDWMEQHKDEIINMFASYGLETESVSERKMSKSEKSKEKRLKDKYDDSGMKQSMKDQYGDDWEQVYFATIRKKAMEQFNETTTAGGIAAVAQPLGKMQRRKTNEKKKSPAGGPPCWDGKKIHPTKPTKMKGGKRVNNCIDADSSDNK
jgi:hypothetical protein